MENQTFDIFNHFLSFEVFRGSSSAGINVMNAGRGAETTAYDTAGAFADLLLNKPKAEGMDGLKKLLENLAPSMTNR